MVGTSDLTPAELEIRVINLHLNLCQDLDDSALLLACTGGNPCYAEIPNNDLINDRKSTRLNSSHTVSSYAFFCLKKKKKSDYDGT